MQKIGEDCSGTGGARGRQGVKVTKKVEKVLTENCLQRRAFLVGESEFNFKASTWSFFRAI